MTRIAQVLAPAAFGGLERVVAGLSVGLAARGHDVHVVALLETGQSPPGFLAEIERKGVTVHRLAHARRGYLSEMRALRRILRREQIEILHTHGDRADLVHGALGAPRGCVRVATVHGFSRNGRWAGVAESLHAMALRRLDAVVAVAHPLYERLLHAGVPAERLHEIVNGLLPAADALSPAAARQQLQLPADAPLIGWVGRLSPEKDPVLAVEALAALRRNDVQLVIIGDGPERDATEARAAALGVRTQLHLVGSQPDAARLLPAFDALLLSSRSEGTPMVMLEAIAAALPVVATPVGGMPAVLGAEGNIASRVDAAALADALARVLGDAGAARRRASALRLRLLDTLLSDAWLGAYERLYASLQGSNVR